MHDSTYMYVRFHVLDLLIPCIIIMNKQIHNLFHSFPIFDTKEITVFSNHCNMFAFTEINTGVFGSCVIQRQISSIGINNHLMLDCCFVSITPFIFPTVAHAILKSVFFSLLN